MSPLKNNIVQFIRQFDIRKKIRFIINGLLTAAVYFSTLYLLNDIIRIHSSLAVTISYFTGTAFNFFAHKFITFREKAVKRLPLQMIKFAGLVLVNYLINLFIANLFLYLNLSVYLGVLCAVIFTTMLSYILMEKFIFR